MKKAVAFLFLCACSQAPFIDTSSVALSGSDAGTDSGLTCKTHDVNPTGEGKANAGFCWVPYFRTVCEYDRESNLTSCVSHHGCFTIEWHGSAGEGFSDDGEFRVELLGNGTYSVTDDGGVVFCTVGDASVETCSR